MYPDADTLFDFSREFTFMDKDLHGITRKRLRRKGKHVVDLPVCTGGTGLSVGVDRGEGTG